MKIYKLEQSKVSGWDTYSDCVVIAENEDEARLISPSGRELDKVTEQYGAWVGKNDIKEIVVEYLGEAKEGSQKGIICASFHAG